MNPNLIVSVKGFVAYCKGIKLTKKIIITLLISLGISLSSINDLNFLSKNFNYVDLILMVSVIIYIALNKKIENIYIGTFVMLVNLIFSIISIFSNVANYNIVVDIFFISALLISILLKLYSLQLKKHIII